MTGRTGELAGHLHGYDPALILRGVAQTVAAGLEYLAMPDEAVDALADRWDPANPFDERCMAPRRDADRRFVYYCLLDEGHDDEAVHELDTLRPEHGWYRLLDAYDLEQQRADEAAERIEARARAARARLQ